MSTQNVFVQRNNEQNLVQPIKMVSEDENHILIDTDTHLRNDYSFQNESKIEKDNTENNLLHVSEESISTNTIRNTGETDEQKYISNIEEYKFPYESIEPNQSKNNKLIKLSGEKDTSDTIETNEKKHSNLVLVQKESNLKSKSDISINLISESQSFIEKNNNLDLDYNSSRIKRVQFIEQPDKVTILRKSSTFDLSYENEENEKRTKNRSKLTVTIPEPVDNSTYVSQRSPNSYYNHIFQIPESPLTSSQETRRMRSASVRVNSPKPELSKIVSKKLINTKGSNSPNSGSSVKSSHNYSVDVSNLSKNELIRIKERNQHVLDEIHIILPSADETDDFCEDSDTEFGDLYSVSSQWNDDITDISNETPKIRNGVNKTELKALFNSFNNKLRKFEKKLINRNTKVLLQSYKTETSPFNNKYIFSEKEMESMTRDQYANYILRCLEEVNNLLSKKKILSSSTKLSSIYEEKIQLSSQEYNFISTVLKETDKYFCKIIDWSSTPRNIIFVDIIEKTLTQEYIYMVDILKAILPLTRLLEREFVLQSYIVQIYSLCMILERYFLRGLAEEGVYGTSKEFYFSRKSIHRILRPGIAKNFVDTEFYDLQVSERIRLKVKESFELHKKLLEYSYGNWEWLGEEGSRSYFESILNFLALFIWSEENERIQSNEKNVKKSQSQTQLNSPKSAMIFNKSKSDNIRKKDKSSFHFLHSHKVKLGLHATLYFDPKQILKHECSKFSNESLCHNLQNSTLRKKNVRYNITRVIRCNCFRKHLINPYSDYGLRFCYGAIPFIQNILNEFMLSKESKMLCETGLLLLSTCYTYNRSFAKKNHFKSSKLQNIEHCVWNIIKTFSNCIEIYYNGFLLLNLLIEENLYSPTTIWKNMVTEHMKSNISFVLEYLLQTVPINFEDPKNTLTYIEIMRFLIYLIYINKQVGNYIRSMSNQENIQFRIETLIHRNRSMRFSRNNTLEFLFVEFWYLIRKSFLGTEDEDGNLDDLISEDDGSCCYIM